MASYEYYVEVYDSLKRAEEEKAGRSEFMFIETTKPLKAGDVIEDIEFSASSTKRKEDKWLAYIPTSPYTVLDVFSIKVGHNETERQVEKIRIYYSGPDKVDFWQMMGDRQYR